jgi:type IV secretory pathway protease TraF
MTDKEHALMMMMFTRQTMYIQMLIDILKRDEIIEGDDVSAFDSAVINDPASISAFERTDAQYRAFAARVNLALPALPPSPESIAQP